MSYEPADVIEVLAWGRRVGAVALNPATGWYSFAYAKEWVAGGIELAPLHMGLREQPYEFPQLRRETFYGLAPAPRRLAARQVRQRARRRLDGRSGRRCRRHHAARPSGLCRGPRHGGPRVPAAGARHAGANRPPRCSWPTWCWRRVCTVRGEFASDETAHAALQQLIQVGTSAGGARAKAVVAFNPESFQVHSAYDDHEEGFEQWLIKLDGVSGTGMDGHGDALGAPRSTGASSTPTAKWPRLRAST